MRVNFNLLEIDNFMSFESEVFDFRKQNGLNLVCGKNNDIPGSKNGSGKSTIFAALCYGLFGETPNKIKNENIKNRYTDKKDVNVVVHFEVEGQNYRIESGLNKSRKAYCNLFSITNGEETNITKSSIAETHNFLEKDILHFDMSLFLRTVLLTSDNQYNFFRLKKQEKKDFIEKLFDISVFGEMYTAIHKDIIAMDKKIIASQNRIIILEKNKDDLNNQFTNFHENKSKQLKSVEDKIDELDKLISEIKNKSVKYNEDEVKKYEDASDKISDAIRKIEERISKIDFNLRRNSSKLVELNLNKKTRKEKISKYSELLNKLCSECKKVFIQYYSLDEIVNEIKKIDNDITDLNDDKTKLDELKEQLTEKVDTYQSKIEMISKKIRDITSEYNKITNELNRTVNESENYKNSKKMIEREIKNNPFSPLIEKNKKELESENSELSEVKNKYKYLKYAETIVSQDTLKKFIIKDLIHLLNNKIVFYLNKLGANYSCVFDENMDYTFRTLGGECEYDSFSSGERMRLNIAVSFAFRDFMATRSNLVSNILILDEYIDSNIDSLAIDGIITILKEYILIYEQNIFVISHRKEVDNSIFNNIIEIQKTNNISKIKYLT